MTTDYDEQTAFNVTNLANKDFSQGPNVGYQMKGIATGDPQGGRTLDFFTDIGSALIKGVPEVNKQATLHSARTEIDEEIDVYADASNTEFQQLEGKAGNLANQFQKLSTDLHRPGGDIGVKTEQIDSLNKEIQEVTTRLAKAAEQRKLTPDAQKDRLWSFVSDIIERNPYYAGEIISLTKQKLTTSNLSNNWIADNKTLTAKADMLKAFNEDLKTQLTSNNISLLHVDEFGNQLVNTETGIVDVDVAKYLIKQKLQVKETTTNLDQIAQRQTLVQHENFDYFVNKTHLLEIYADGHMDHLIVSLDNLVKGDIWKGLANPTEKRVMAVQHMQGYLNTWKDQWAYLGAHVDKGVYQQFIDRFEKPFNAVKELLLDTVDGTADNAYILALEKRITARRNIQGNFARVNNIVKFLEAVQKVHSAEFKRAFEGDTEMITQIMDQLREMSGPLIESLQNFDLSAEDQAAIDKADEILNRDSVVTVDGNLKAFHAEPQFNGKTGAEVYMDAALESVLNVEMHARDDAQTEEFYSTQIEQRYEEFNLILGNRLNAIGVMDDTQKQKAYGSIVRQFSNPNIINTPLQGVSDGTKSIFNTHLRDYTSYLDTKLKGFVNESQGPGPVQSQFEISIGPSGNLRVEGFNSQDTQTLRKFNFLLSEISRAKDAYGFINGLDSQQAAQEYYQKYHPELFMDIQDEDLTMADDFGIQDIGPEAFEINQYSQAAIDGSMQDWQYISEQMQNDSKFIELSDTISNTLGVERQDYLNLIQAISNMESYGGRYDAVGITKDKDDKELEMWGKYQFHPDTRKEIAEKYLKISNPTKENFLNNPLLQEQMYTIYSAQVDRHLKSESPKYSAMTPLERLPYIAAGQLGMGNLVKYIEKGIVKVDGKETRITEFIDEYNRYIASITSPPEATFYTEGDSDIKGNMSFEEVTMPPSLIIDMGRVLDEEITGKNATAIKNKFKELVRKHENKSK